MFCIFYFSSKNIKLFTSMWRFASFRGGIPFLTVDHLLFIPPNKSQFCLPPHGCNFAQTLHWVEETPRNSFFLFLFPLFFVKFYPEKSKKNLQDGILFQIRDRNYASATL